MPLFIPPTSDEDDMAPFSEAQAKHAALEADVRRLSAALNAFPKGARGLTPDAVKFSPAYVAAKRDFDTAFSIFRNFNGWFAKRFADELRAERNGRRTAA